VAQATATADGTRVPDFMMQAYSGQNASPVKAGVPKASTNAHVPPADGGLSNEGQRGVPDGIRPNRFGSRSMI